MCHAPGSRGHRFDGRHDPARSAPVVAKTSGFALTATGAQMLAEMADA
jgi:hypothetical protein